MSSISGYTVHCEASYYIGVYHICYGTAEEPQHNTPSAQRTLPDGYGLQWFSAQPASKQPSHMQLPVLPSFSYLVENEGWPYAEARQARDHRPDQIPRLHPVAYINPEC
ncbi:hypothetical protein D3C80_1512410 [compost metagenome]